ncbi:MAG TPA: MFS transporter [Chloroflexota bacterium]|jgi:MFS family permease|nr:MFS transporter [Chloroflexota bacterium]
MIGANRPVEPRRRAFSKLRLTHILLPDGISPDAGVLLGARAVRAFGDGFVSVLLPVYLLGLGYGAVAVGTLSTATLLGSAVLTLLVGLFANRFGRKGLLLAACWLMAATGVAFATVHAFWPLLLVAFVGTLNPSSGDVSVFLPLEQSLLPQTAEPKVRTALFARYSVAGTLAAAVGALCAGVPAWLASRTPLDTLAAIQVFFIVYGLLGLVAFCLYRRLPVPPEPSRVQSAPLRESRRTVFTLSALFSLDAFGGGLVVQSLLALWLFQRFNLSLESAGSIFFWTGVMATGSFLLAVPLAARFGLIHTMVFTHLPSNVFLALVPFMPSLPLAIALLLMRSALSQMDVPTRGSYVMAVVPAEERAAAASITSVPRSLASALGPLPAGFLLALSPFGWPLVIAGVLKGIYDLLLLALFARVQPPEERDARSQIRPTSPAT